MVTMRIVRKEGACCGHRMLWSPCGSLERRSLLWSPCGSLGKELVVVTMRIVRKGAGCGHHADR